MFHITPRIARNIMPNIDRHTSTLVFDGVDSAMIMPAHAKKLANTVTDSKMTEMDRRPLNKRRAAFNPLAGRSGGNHPP